MFGGIITAAQPPLVFGALPVIASATEGFTSVPEPRSRPRDADAVGALRGASADPHPPSYLYPIYAGFLMGIVAVSGAVGATGWFLARLLLR